MHHRQSLVLLFAPFALAGCITINVYPDAAAGTPRTPSAAEPVVRGDARTNTRGEAPAESNPSVAYTQPPAQRDPTQEVRSIDTGWVLPTPIEGRKLIDTWIEETPDCSPPYRITQQGARV